MVDSDPFLTTLAVLVDDCCKTALPAASQPGPQAARSRREVLTLAIFGPWQGCGSERGCSRSAQRHVRGALPPLPPRAQCPRQMRRHHEALVACLLPLVHLLAAQRCPYEALDSSGVPTRAAKRRGAGWVPGLAAIGWSNRLGWYADVHLLLAVTPVGVMTGVGFGPASSTDHPLAETCFAWRRHPYPGVSSVGAPALGPSGVEKGCAGQAHHATWKQTSGAQVICPPKRKSTTPWPQSQRRWLAGIRQVVETVDDKRAPTCRLDRERPHARSGLRARLAAKVALHTFCIWLHEQLGRPRLAFTDLVNW